MGAEGDGGLLRFLIVIAFGLPAAEIKDKNGRDMIDFIMVLKRCNLDTGSKQINSSDHT
jgi:hypothetical protein